MEQETPVYPGLQKQVPRIQVPFPEHPSKHKSNYLVVDIQLD